MKSYKRFFLLICFLVYVCVLFYLLFFSSYRQSVEGLLTYNVRPFQTILGYFSNFDGLSITDQFVGNVLAFVPFGFLLPLLVSRLGSFIRMVWGTVAFSLLVEIAQLIFRVGAFDVDDLLLNTIGGVIGFLLMTVFNKRPC
ncbi:VanZ family protein [Metabacillus bambusae]|uniref:VanZ family protein n=1 Tax=Metabacillus bambusae TaxID=2795218 RepID=A0ABS3N191_9BACI|nr:VanZ family protein [Metabacillus bambusae]MBO1511939.1 VanZ family protein [Metabacillus bambusae]